jgi:hypothetical protein
MLGSHNAIDIPQSTEYAKEMRKWEATHTRFGPPGRPYVFSEFPKRMYKAERVEGKGIQVVDQQRASNPDEERNLLSRGFYEGQGAAFEAIEREQTEHGRLAAEREYAIQHGRLSEKAVEEVRTAEEAHGARHLPDLEVTPIRRGPGRPKSVAPVE